MSGFCSFPQVMGHEVVADVVALGPEARGFEVGQRVVLNPWLSCGPRGIEPPCPACEAGDYSLCWSFTDGDISRHPYGGFGRRHRRLRRVDACPRQMLFPVPDGVRRAAVFADPFAVSLHASPGTRRRRGPGAGVGPGARVVRGRDPAGAPSGRRGGGGGPLDAQAPLADNWGRHGAAPGATALWSSWRLVRRRAAPAHGGPDDVPPRPIDVAYDTMGKPETFEVEVRVLAARGAGQGGVHAPGRWEWSPLYFKEISWVGSNAFGIEEVDGVRNHGIEHYLDLAAAGRVDLGPRDPHVPARSGATHSPRSPTRRTAAPSRSPSTSASYIGFCRR